MPRRVIPLHSWGLDGIRTWSALDASTLRLGKLPYRSKTVMTFLEAAEYLVKSSFTKMRCGHSFLAMYPGIADR